MKNLYSWEKFNEEYFIPSSRECLYLGPTPTDEEAVQVSEEDYTPAMIEQVDRYVEMLQNRFPNCTNVTIKRDSQPHDFGTYYEAVVWYNEQYVGEALFIEHNLPEKWSDTEVLTYTPDVEEDDLEIEED